jgi:hypothetical protein
MMAPRKQWRTPAVAALVSGFSAASLHVQLPALLLSSVIATTVSCSKKSEAGVAKLVKTSGPVEKNAAGSAWKSADIGTMFDIGDAARTGDGGAQLALNGGSELAMEPHSVLRFGGAKKQFDVELGAVELRGGGAFDLELGRVEISKGGGVRITRGSDKTTTFDLLLGEVSVLRDGKATALQAGKPFTFDLGDVQVTPMDAPPAKVPVDAGDAGGLVMELGEVSVLVSGPNAQVQLAGSKDWVAMEAGQNKVPAGATLRMGAATTAKLTHAGTVLDLNSGSRVVVSEAFDMTLQAGGGTASVDQGVIGKFAIPGGSVTLLGDKGPVISRIDVDARESKVAISRGMLELTSKDGTKLPMNKGDSAALTKAGAIRVIDSIPTYYDVSIAVGSSMQIHDPKGATAIRFEFRDKCSGGGDVELDRDNRFKTPRVSTGTGSANHSVSGSWSYRLRCSGKVVASGRVSVLRDSGERKLSPKEVTNAIEADGRNYTISYQSLVPNIQVKWKGATGTNFKLFLASGGKSQTFASATPQVTVPGKAFKEGEFTYWFEREGGGVAKSKVSTLTMDFDQQAAQVYIESPPNGTPFGAAVEVRGAALAGWTAFGSDGKALKLDKQHRFNATFDPPSEANALAIRLSHPQFGEHIYVRRGK